MCVAEPGQGNQGKHLADPNPGQERSLGTISQSLENELYCCSLLDHLEW